MEWPRRLASSTLFVALLGFAGRAGAVPHVTQVIDGLPQVIVPQQLVVRCNPSVLPALCSAALGAVSAIVTVVGQTAFNLVQLPVGVPLQGVLDTLRATTAIASAEPNRLLIGSTTWPQTWNFPAIQAPGDATLLPAGMSPVVAVLDTGIAYENSFMGVYARAPVFSSTQFAPGWDFVNGDGYPDDDNGHGTAMASIIAGRGTFSSSGADIPYVGPAAGAILMPVKVLDANNQGTEYWLAEGIRFAVGSGAQVINLSLDFARNYVPGAALRDAIAAARAANVVLVAASGNAGSGRVLYPAAFPDVVSVGALRLDAVAGYVVTGYANSGEDLDLVAPGGVTDLDVNQDGLWDGVLAQSFPAGTPAEIGWWLFAGTSPAAAHASAAAAALLGNGAAPGKVRPVLQATARSFGAAAFSPSWGSGRIQVADAIGRIGAGFTAPRPLYADAVVALRTDGRASGAVMVADGSGNPVSGVEVHARWRGAATGTFAATTDYSGIARFVSPAPTSSRKLFVLEVPRVLYRGAAQRPRAFARSGGWLSGLAISVSLPAGGPPSPTDGLNIWGYGYSQDSDSGLASGTTGSGLASGTTGSGLASGTTGSTGVPPPNYPLTSGINACLGTLQVQSYGPLSLSASWAFFSGAILSPGYSVRTIDSSWVLAPGAAAIDLVELGNICGISVAWSKALSSSYFTSGTLSVADAGRPPPIGGAGDSARFWSEVMNAEGSTAP